METNTKASSIKVFTPASVKLIMLLATLTLVSTLINQNNNLKKNKNNLKQKKEKVSAIFGVHNST